MMIMFLPIKHVENDFDALKVVILIWRRAFWMAKRRRRRIAGIGGWRPMSNTKITCRSIKLCSNCHFRSFESFGKDKEGKCVPHELKPRDIERPKTIYEILFGQQKKGFLHRIITEDEKWIYFDSLKRQKTICNPGQLSTLMPKRNIHGKKTTLYLMGSEEYGVPWAVEI